MGQAKRLEEALGRGWTKGFLALDVEGREVSPIDPRASSFCLAGAVAYAKAGTPRDVSLARLVSGELSSGWMRWNDDPDRTYAEVLALARRVNEAAVLSEMVSGTDRKPVLVGA